MNRIHFISSMSGPLASLFGEMRGRSKFSVFIDDAQRRQLERLASELSLSDPAHHAVDIRTA